MAHAAAATTTETAERKSFGEPDEVREFPRGRLELIKVGGAVIGRAVFEPGWQWSKHVKPIAETDSCMAAHTGYCVSGHMHVAMTDGQEADIGPGEFLEIAPGHDAWVIGDEPCVMIDWQGFADYAKAK